MSSMKLMMNEHILESSRSQATWSGGPVPIRTASAWGHDTNNHTTKTTAITTTTAITSIATTRHAMVVLTDAIHNSLSAWCHIPGMLNYAIDYCVINFKLPLQMVLFSVQLYNFHRNLNFCKLSDLSVFLFGWRRCYSTMYLKS